MKIVQSAILGEKTTAVVQGGVGSEADEERKRRGKGKERWLS